MLKLLNLRLHEYDAMVRKGAFNGLGRRVELIRGEIVEMTPAGPIHDDYVTYLTTWSATNIDLSISMLTSQTGIDLPEIDSRPEPDVFWVRKARYRKHHPLATDVQLAIEVADSSLEKDLEIKRKLYAEVGIREYWIVDCRADIVHVLRSPINGDFRFYDRFLSPKTISPLIAPNAILDLHDLFSGS